MLRQMRHIGCPERLCDTYAIQFEHKNPTKTPSKIYCFYRVSISNNFIVKYNVELWSDALLLLFFDKSLVCIYLYFDC